MHPGVARKRSCGEEIRPETADCATGEQTAKPARDKRRTPLRSLRFARALSRDAPCAGSLRKLRFLRCISPFSTTPSKARSSRCPVSFLILLPVRVGLAAKNAKFAKALRSLRPLRLKQNPPAVPTPPARSATNWVWARSTGRALQALPRSPSSSRPCSLQVSASSSLSAVRRETPA